MDSTTLIVTALAAGASAGALDGLSDDVREAAKAAYRRLHYLVKRCFRGNPSAEVILYEHEADPKTYEAQLAKKLAEAGADNDVDLVAAARALMELVDQEGAKSGRYHVVINNSKGVQVGDNNVQVNRF
jgi:RIP homotypic interaction motif